MHIVLVHIHVKTSAIESFIIATIENARNSLLEAGVRRFDFLQQSEDPTRFTLIEVYDTPEEQLKHRETCHYNTWKNTVVDMMAEPRQGIRYTHLFPIIPKGSE